MFICILVLLISLDHVSINPSNAGNFPTLKIRDISSLDLNHCQEDAHKGPSCEIRFGTAKETLLLIGDSHAHHLVPGLIVLARANNWNLVVWAQSACNFQFKESSRVSANCIANNKQILKWIELHRPRKVLLSQFIRQDSELKLIHGGVDRLKSVSPRLFVLENSPVFPDQSEFLVEKSRLEVWVKGKYQAPKMFRLDQMDTSNEKANNQYKSDVKILGVKVISIDGAFCDDYICTRKIKSSWLYKDSNHFSTAGSILAGEYLSQMKELLAQD